jgi:hypothetical protein
MTSSAAAGQDTRSQWSRIRERFFPVSASSGRHSSASSASSADAVPPATPSSNRNDAWRALITEIEADEREASERTSQLRSGLEAYHRSKLGAGCPVPTTPGFVRCCLRAKKYQVPKALQLATNYAQFRVRAGWGPGAVTAAELRPELSLGLNLLLPNPDAQGNVVLTQSMSKMLDAGSSLERLQRAGYYLLHRALQRREAQERGIALLLDFQGFSLSALRNIRMEDLRRGVSMLQDCFPARLCVIYVLNEPRWLLLLVQLLRPLLSRDSMEQKFRLCGKGEGLRPHIPAAQLPSSLGLGGTLEFDWEAQLQRWEAEEARLGPSSSDPALLLDAEESRAAVANSRRSRRLES